MTARADTPTDPLLEALLHLNRILVRENLGMTTYAIMLALAGGDGWMSVARLSILVGLTGHGLRQQVRRTEWFQIRHDHPFATVHLLPKGAEKLASIDRRLAAAAKATP